MARIALAVACLLLGWAADGQPAPRALVANPGFEDGLAGWTAGHTWYENPKGSGISAVSIDDTVARSGKRSLRIDGKSNRGIAMQVFRVRPGKYHLSGWIRARGLGAANAAILAEWMGRDGKWLAGSPIASVTGDSDWRLVEGDVEAPADARSIHLDLLTSAANSGSAWFDDISLNRVPVPTAPPGPLTVTAETPADTSGELLVRWKAPAAPDAAEYRVYWSDKPFQSARTLKPALTVDGDSMVARLTGLTNGRPAYVAVVGVSLEGLALEQVSSVAATPRDRRAPQVAAFTATPLAAGARLAPAAQLAWDVAPEDRDVAGFTVTANGALLRRLPSDARSLLLTSLPRVDLRLGLTATDRSGNVSKPAEVHIKCPPPGQGASGVYGVVRIGSLPVSKARVEVRRAGRVVALALTGPDGRYRIGDLPIGTFLLQVAHAGKMPASRPIWILTGGGAVSADVQLSPAVAWTAWTVSPVAQVFRDDQAPAGASQRIAITSLANQTRDAQIVLRPTQDMTLEGVRFEPLVASDGARAIGAENLSYNFVSYCPLKRNSTAMAPEELVHKAPGDFPDELSDDASRDVKAGQTQPIFVSVHVPSGTPAGRYAGRAFVQTPLGEQPIDLEVRVLPLEFPSRTRLFCVNWLDWSAIARKHGVAVWSDAFWDVARIYTKLMREHHQNVVVLPPDLCAIYVEPDRSVTFDWSLFDRAAEFFIREGVGERLCIGHLGGRTTGEWECPTFSLSPRPATVRETGAATTVTPEQFVAALQAHLEQKGWLGRALQHVGDEPIPVNMASYREQSARVHRAAPKLRRIDAIQTPDLKGSLEVWVPQLNYFDQWYEGYRKFQQAGDAELWFYIAWVPQGKYPQRLIDTQAIKARTIHWMNYLWDTTGYLHWALEWWDIDVESLAPGDSRIIWPGRKGPNSSLRYEAQREGLEDCELLFMLEDAYREAAQKLGVAGFDAKARPRELGHSVVRTITDYTRSYDELEAARTQVAEEIAALRQGPALLTAVSRTADRPVPAGAITLQGWTEPGAEVTVNGQPVAVKDGQFQATLTVSAANGDLIVRTTRGGRSVEVRRKYRVQG